jgi:hypothetical protein
MNAQSLNPFNLLLLMKYIRPYDVESYVSDFFSQSFMKQFYNVPRSNIDTMSRSKVFKRPIVVYTGIMHKSLTEAIELKAFRIDKSIKVNKLTLGNISL